MSFSNEERAELIAALSRTAEMVGCWRLKTVDRGAAIRTLKHPPLNPAANIHEFSKNHALPRI